MGKCIFIVLVLLVGIVSGASLGGPQTLTRVSPSQNVAGVNQQFIVDITVSDVQNLFALEARLFWNSSILQLLDTTNMLGVESHLGGILHGSISQSEERGIGEYRIYGTSIGAQTPSFNGSGTIAELAFNVTDFGSCDLILQTRLYDKPLTGEASTQIQHSTQNGHYSAIYIAAAKDEITVKENVSITVYANSTPPNMEVTLQSKKQNQMTWQVVETFMNFEDNATTQISKEEEAVYEFKAVATVEGKKAESVVMAITVKSLDESSFWFYVMIIVGAVTAIIALSCFMILKKRKKQTS